MLERTTINLKSIWCLILESTQAIPHKMKKARNIVLPNSKVNYKAMVSKQHKPPAKQQQAKQNKPKTYTGIKYTQTEDKVLY